MKNEKYTGYPSIDLPQTKDSTFFEKNPIIPNVDVVTLLNLLRRKDGNLPAIDSNELKATYGQLKKDAHQLYLAFKELGVKKGNIVTISLPSNYHAIACFLIFISTFVNFPLSFLF